MHTLTQTTKAQRHRGDEGHRKTGGVPGLGDAGAGSDGASAGSEPARGRFQRQVTDTLVMEATTRAQGAAAREAAFSAR
ncbi:hypothetical protein [uncultured Actinomyces sp.]|uniref:hypothetical protein n=1 Tax=uncultured Actinomyces sp. TaxID=249061 RepID=UPI0028EFD873|nr:hypothetical protein [uncultured Actinomyces sp.]